MAKLLCICIGLTKFEENPEGSSIFCVDLTWNDPLFFYRRRLDLGMIDPPNLPLSDDDLLALIKEFQQILVNPWQLDF